MRRSLVGLGASMLLALSASASAQTPSELERAKASFKAGANAYAAGDYLAAIQALEAAYELTPLPAIAFSLAQAERKEFAARQEREHQQRALALFRRYLEQEPNGPRKSDAQLAITELLSAAPKPAAAVAEAQPKLQARPTRIMIVSDVPGARISLDGGPLSASPLIREVSAGKHRAHVEATGYFDSNRDVTALASELILSEIRLTERPSSLYVWAPLDADIYVDGVYVAQGGKRVTVPLAIGPHQLTVAQKGRRAVRRDLRLERGQSHTEVVYLEPTVQRELSEWLFIAGGGALGLSMVASAFAVRSENRAEAFLGRRKQHNWTPEELSAYSASIVERNRYRSAAVIGVAGSLGLFITGLFLHTLDQPNLAAAPAQGRAPARDAGLTFAPISPTGDPGAALSLHF